MTSGQCFARLMRSSFRLDLSSGRACYLLKVHRYPNILYFRSLTESCLQIHSGPDGELFRTLLDSPSLPTL